MNEVKGLILTLGWAIVSGKQNMIKHTQNTPTHTLFK